MTQCCSFNPKTVRPEPVEGLPFDRLKANGAKWISQIEQYCDMTMKAPVPQADHVVRC
jgi:hypothetical protein